LVRRRDKNGPNGHWGGRISLPLAVGVDRGHPQATGSGSRPPPMAGSIYLFFFFFLVRWFAGETNRATEGGQISPPGRWGGSRARGHPQWLDLFSSSFFFLPEKSPKNEVGGGVCLPEVGGGEWRSLGWLVDWVF
jgi:hypothetical protein